MVQVFGAAQAHHAHLFTHTRGNRIKILTNDGECIWFACRRLNEGRFKWPPMGSNLSLTREQFDARVLVLSWKSLVDGGAIVMV